MSQASHDTAGRASTSVPRVATCQYRSSSLFIVPPIIWFAPLDIEAGAKHALAITSFMVLAWITKAMDYAVAGLIGCYLFMFDWMEPLLTNAFSSTLVLYWTGFVYHFFLASEISMLATSMPLLMDFAKSHGLSPLMLGMVWSFSAAGKIFVYQSAVMIVGYSYGFFAGKDLFRMGLWLTVVESLILLLLVPYYWPLLGIQ